MRSIYSDGQGKTLLLYPYSKIIYFRSISQENPGKPVILCHDYLDGLSDTLYQSRIYYSYINTNHNILIKSITGPNILYLLEGENGFEYAKPILLSFSSQLFLLYAVKNPVNHTWLINLLLPFKKETAITIPCVFMTKPQLCAAVSDEYAIISIHDSEKTCIFKITLSEQKVICTTLDNEQSMIRKQKEYYEKQLKQRDELIESIKKQYEELMQTAYRYRDAALHRQNQH